MVQSPLVPKILNMGWLTKEGNLKRASSIVGEFTDPAMANADIYRNGVGWPDTPMPTLVNSCAIKVNALSI